MKVEFATFLGERFLSPDALTDRWALQPLVWWQYPDSSFPTLQTLTLKLLGQPYLSSCAERNWSTYKFIHSLKRNKMALAHAEDLVYMHSNLRLLSRRNEEYVNTATKMWDIAGDSWNEINIHGGAGILENEVSGFFHQMPWQIGGPYNIWFCGNTMAPHFKLFKPLPLNFLNNLVYLHVLRGIRAHKNSFIL